MADEDYNALLSPGYSRGVCGKEEIHEEEASVEMKVRQLAEMVRRAKHVIVFTGAGISTSAGIADFRGPQGVWTIEEKLKKKKMDEIQQHHVEDKSGKTKRLKSKTKKEVKQEVEEEDERKVDQEKEMIRDMFPERSVIGDIKGLVSPKSNARFEEAMPTKTHMALLQLYRSSLIHFVVSQNVDGLHMFSGLPRSSLAELHGNVFLEFCPDCGREFVRQQAVRSVGFKKTGRTCAECGGELRDNTLDWLDALPERELQLTDFHSKSADLCICLGSSLQVYPVCGMPLKTLRTYKDIQHPDEIANKADKKRHSLKTNPKTEPGKLVIVNLQTTRYDKRASLVIHSTVDRVMEMLMGLLGLEIPLPQRLSVDLLSQHFVSRVDPVCCHQRLNTKQQFLDETVDDDREESDEEFAPKRKKQRRRS